jgi:CRP-like cAMP-binding protein
VSDAIVRRFGYNGLVFLSPTSTLATACRAAVQYSAAQIVPSADAAVRFVASGWLIECREAPDGRTQIIRTILPGELVDDILGGSEPVMYRTITRAALVDLKFLKDDERFRLAFRREAAAVARQLKLQVYRIGILSAAERTAHTLLEIDARWRANTQDTSPSIPFPLCQTDMAALLGLSSVHMNRTVQFLRRKGLIELRARALKILDREALVEISGWHPEDALLEPAVQPERGAQNSHEVAA